MKYVKYVWTPLEALDAAMGVIDAMEALTEDIPNLKLIVPGLPEVRERIMETIAKAKETK